MVMVMPVQTGMTGTHLKQDEMNPLVSQVECVCATHLGKKPSRYIPFFISYHRAYT